MLVLSKTCAFLPPFKLKWACLEREKKNSFRQIFRSQSVYYSHQAGQWKTKYTFLWRRHLRRTGIHYGHRHFKRSSRLKNYQYNLNENSWVISFKPQLLKVSLRHCRRRRKLKKWLYQFFSFRYLPANRVTCVALTAPVTFRFSSSNARVPGVCISFE